jgi:LysR family transcriptional regulator for metE and metH
MDIDTRDIELLEAIERTGTLTAAAEQLYVSQPALSQRLARLEQQLGAPLYERQGRRLVPTRVGRRMQQAARLLLSELRTAEQDVRALVDGGRRPLRLTSQCTTHYEWLVPVLQRFRGRRPGVDVRIEQLSEDDPLGALLEDRVDLALVAKLDSRSNQVRLHRLFDDEVRAVVRTGHPLALRSHLDAGDIADAQLVLSDSYDPRRPSPVPLPLPPQMRPGRLTALPVSTDVLLETVAASDDVTVLPSWTVAPYLRTHDLATVQIGATPQLRTWYVATQHGERSDASDDLLALLQDHFAGERAPLTAAAG